MTLDPLELEVEARVENLGVIDDFITEAMKRFGAEEESFRVQLAVNEACTNVIQYAYSGGGEQPIHILCSAAGSDLVVRIRDWGRPFEPDSVPAPDTEAELSERKLGGLGILLIRQMMHDVRYVFHDSGCNELIMTRHLAPEG